MLCVCIVLSFGCRLLCLCCACVCVVLLSWLCLVVFRDVLLRVVSHCAFWLCVCCVFDVCVSGCVVGG